MAGVGDQVGPRDRAAVLLLDRPEQTARLVEADVVGPAVQRGEPLSAAVGATPAVADAVRAGRVPRHPDEEWAVVAVVGRPPVLRGGHHLGHVTPQRLDVERLERLGVLVVVAHHVWHRDVLAQHAQVDLVGPPVLVRPRSAARWLGCRDDWVLALTHVAGPLQVCGSRCVVQGAWFKVRVTVSRCSNGVGPTRRTWRTDPGR
jgi:hypothetical protein